MVDAAQNLPRIRRAVATSVAHDSLLRCRWCFQVDAAPWVAKQGPGRASTTAPELCCSAPSRHRRVRETPHCRHVQAMSPPSAVSPASGSTFIIPHRAIRIPPPSSHPALQVGVGAALVRVLGYRASRLCRVSLLALNCRTLLVFGAVGLRNSRAGVSRNAKTGRRAPIDDLDGNVQLDSIAHHSPRNLIPNQRAMDGNFVRSQAKCRFAIRRL